MTMYYIDVYFSDDDSDDDASTIWFTGWNDI